ncbi:GntR family transcriptional regulator [Pradoshia eiseniae]|uniref:GntR family transcriptional regulator n=1 Tax=Pradoshia eiseniae TaxID=2064768 RepID=A0A2S7N3R6_9BACI|nr:GntR family transcriptional regulator [Pradoshia eiseniae]PQD96666.1 GntR family transcriptional regulator [Pradoshia eiseniae]
MSKKEFVYKHLRTSILDGTFGSGQRIVIDQVAKEMGMSIIPVREAIRQLESDGLITYKPYSGAVVTSIDEKEYIDTLMVLSVLEGYATALSSEHLTSIDISRLIQLNRDMEKAVEEFEFELFGDLNRTFHASIIQKCGNPVLIEKIEETQDRMDRVRKSIFSMVPKRAQQSIQEHAELIQCLKEKAPSEQIEAIIRNHRKNTVEAFLNRKDKNEQQIL